MPYSVFQQKNVNAKSVEEELEKVLLGSKTLGLNVFELQFIMLENHNQNVLVFVLDLLKVCLHVKLESSGLQDLMCKSVWLNRSKVMQIIFLQNFSNSA